MKAGHQYEIGHFDYFPQLTQFYNNLLYQFFHTHIPTTIIIDKFIHTIFTYQLAKKKKHLKKIISGSGDQKIHNI